MAGIKKLDDFDRIMAKVDRTGECWLWTGGQNGRGYGRTHVGSQIDGTFRYTTLHRYMYERFKGPIPDELVIDHLCRVRHCCNPSHLEAVTHHENLRRGDVWSYPRKGLNNPRPKRRRTHCRFGHPKREIPSGERVCDECRRNQAARKASAA